MWSEKTRILFSPQGIKYAFRAIFVLAGGILSYLSSSLYAIALHDMWKRDPEFVKIRKQVLGRSMLDTRKLHVFYNLARTKTGQPGDIAEIGVYKGGTAKILCEVFGADSARPRIHLFDTFEGMIETKNSDEVFEKGNLSDTSVESVREFLGNPGYVDFHKGPIAETRCVAEDLQFKFVHIDVDLYQSHKECIDYFYDRLLPGGIMVFDDYGALSCPNASLAIDEFCKERGIHSVYLYTTQAIIIKSATPA